MVAAFALCAAPAAAVTFTFDLNGTGSNSGSGHGNSRSWSQTIQGLNVQVKATAWMWNGTTLRNATLARYNQGLGVVNRTGESANNNTHTVDNQTGFDFIVFQFNRNVQLTGVTANAFSLNNSIDNDLTVGRAINTPNTLWNSTLTGWDNKAVSNMATLFQAQKHINSSMTGNTLDVNRVLNPTGSFVTGKVWMISASLVNSDFKTDAFKLDTLKINTTNTMSLMGPTPEPGTWAMMILGFGTIGATLRRRRAMASAAAI